MSMKVMEERKIGGWRLADGSLATECGGKYFVEIDFPSVVETEEVEFDTFDELVDYAKQVYNNEVYIKRSNAHDAYMAGIRYDGDAAHEGGLSVKGRLEYWAHPEMQEMYGSFALGRLFRYKQLLGLVN